MLEDIKTKDAEMNEFLSNVPAFRSGKAVEIVFALFKKHFGVILFVLPWSKFCVTFKQIESLYVQFLVMSRSKHLVCEMFLQFYQNGYKALTVSSCCGRLLTPGRGSRRFISLQKEGTWRR